MPKIQNRQNLLHVLKIEHTFQTKVKRLACCGGRQMNDLDLKWTFEVPMMDVIQKVVNENKKHVFGRSNKLSGRNGK